MKKVSSPITFGVALFLLSLIAQPGHAYTTQKVEPGGKIKSPYVLTCNDGAQFGVGLDNHGGTISADARTSVCQDLCKTHGGFAKPPSKDVWDKGLPSMVLVADEPMRERAPQPDNFRFAVSVVYPTCPAGWALVANPGSDTCTSPVPAPVPGCPSGKTLAKDKDTDGKRDVCQ